jgi:hypothetical protein
MESPGLEYQGGEQERQRGGISNTIPYRLVPRGGTADSSACDPLNGIGGRDTWGPIGSPGSILRRTSFSFVRWSLLRNTAKQPRMPAA